jgi:hypothetical protein
MAQFQNVSDRLFFYKTGYLDSKMPNEANSSDGIELVKFLTFAYN